MSRSCLTYSLGLYRSLQRTCSVIHHVQPDHHRGGDGIQLVQALDMYVLAAPPSVSRIDKSSDSIIFIVADTVALVVQAVGGGKASGANSWEEAQRGADIMVGGIIVCPFVLFNHVVALISLPSSRWVRLLTSRYCGHSLSKSISCHHDLQPHPG